MYPREPRSKLYHCRPSGGIVHFSKVDPVQCSSGLFSDHSVGRFDQGKRMLRRFDFFRYASLPVLQAIVKPSMRLFKQRQGMGHAPLPLCEIAKNWGMNIQRKPLRSSLPSPYQTPSLPSISRLDQYPQSSTLSTWQWIEHIIYRVDIPFSHHII